MADARIRSASPSRPSKRPCSTISATARTGSAPSAAAREHGLTYGRFIDGLTKAGIEVDRKVLADIAVKDNAAFKALVDQAQAALPKAA